MLPGGMCGPRTQITSGTTIALATTQIVAMRTPCRGPAACPPAAGGCPDPQSVEQGVSCYSPGLQCPGNPNYCDGALFYDAFECDGGLWNDIAVTGCPQDGGSGSSSGGSSGSSGGGSVDAGAPDAKGP